MTQSLSFLALYTIRLYRANFISTLFQWLYILNQGIFTKHIALVVWQFSEAEKELDN